MRTVLVMNSGSINGHAFADPSAVTPGVIAMFDENGDAQDMTSDTLAALQKILFVQGHSVQPRMSAIIDRNKIIEVVKRVYVAPVKQVTTISGLTDLEGVATLKIIDMSLGHEQYPRRTYEISSATADTVDSVIRKLIAKINADSKGVVYARSNRISTVAVTGTSGTANINIDGTNYLATFDTDVTTTADDFRVAHAATILAAHGLTVTDNAGTLTFTPTSANAANASLPTVTNVSGDLGGTVADPTDQTEIVLTARDFDTSFQTSIDGILADGTIAATTAPLKGNGTYAQVLELEQRYRGYMTGEYYTNSGILGAPDPVETFAVDGNTYDIYVVRVETDHDDNVGRTIGVMDVILALESDITGDPDTFFGATLRTAA